MVEDKMVLLSALLLSLLLLTVYLPDSGNAAEAAEESRNGWMFWKRGASEAENKELSNLETMVDFMQCPKVAASQNRK